VKCNMKEQSGCPLCGAPPSPGHSIGRPAFFVYGDEASRTPRGLRGPPDRMGRVVDSGEALSTGQGPHGVTGSPRRRGAPLMYPRSSGSGHVREYCEFFLIRVR
jgi:hypothetical protein